MMIALIWIHHRFQQRVVRAAPNQKSRLDLFSMKWRAQKKRKRNMSGGVNGSVSLLANRLMHVWVCLLVCCVGGLRACSFFFCWICWFASFQHMATFLPCGPYRVCFCAVSPFASSTVLPVFFFIVV